MVVAGVHEGRLDLPPAEGNRACTLIGASQTHGTWIRHRKTHKSSYELQALSSVAAIERRQREPEDIEA